MREVVMHVKRKVTLAGVVTVLILDEDEIRALRLVEAIAEEMREIANNYEKGGEGSKLDEDLARCEHGAGNLVDEGPEFTLEYKEVDLTDTFVVDIIGA